MPALTPTALAWLFTALVFTADLFVTTGAPLRVLYLGPVLMGLWSTDRLLSVKVAALATVLSVLHLWSGAEGSRTLAEVLTQSSVLHGVWVTALGVAYWRRTAGAMAEAQRDLAHSTKELQDVRYALDQSAIVATTNVRGDITYVNDKFCEISGYSRAELLGANHRILNSGLHPPEFFVDLYRTIASGRVWRGEIRNRAKDGHLYWVDTTIVPFLNEAGRPYQYVAVRYDITERKLTEATLRQQESLAKLGRMAAVVAHEVRNPLAGIKGAVQIIGRRLPSGATEAVVVGEIVSRIDALDDIVQDLLLFARPRPPAPAPVPVRHIVEDTLGLLRNDPRHSKAAIETRLSDAVALADRDQISQVLLNLLLNALQATPTPMPVTVTAGAADGWCELAVVDRGPGIPEDVREHLFEPFFTTKSRGTGLGLATARRIVEAHGGEVILESRPEGGTRAVIRLKTETSAA